MVRTRCLRAALLVAALLALAACAGKPQRETARTDHPPAWQAVDSAPPIPIDLDAIPEPVPKDEPRARYGNHSPYEVLGKRYHVLPQADGYVARGTASWYGTKFHGRLTSNREPYDMYGYTAAHKTLPLPTYARVTNLDNGRSIVVRINDRGPFVGNRLIDLSYVAAVKLGVHIRGTAPVEVRVLDPRQPQPPEGSADLVATTAVPEAVSGTLAVLDAPAPLAAPAQPRSPGPMATEPMFKSQWYLQFGAFSAADNARMLRARLNAAGFDQIDVHTDEADGRSPWRVLAGPYQDRIEAIAAQQSASARGFPGARIVER